jgi:hypothetical protein
MCYALVKLSNTWKSVDKCQIFKKLTENINSIEMLNYFYDDKIFFGIKKAKS